MQQEHEDNHADTATEPLAVPLRISMDLPSARQYLSGLRRTANCLLESAGVPKTDIDDIEMLLGELASNAVMHAGTNSFRVEVELRDDWVLVIVSDRGRGFPVGGIAPPGTIRPAMTSEESGEANATADVERFGGWGLPLVRRLADRMEILATQPHGTTVLAERQVGRSR